MDHGPRRRWSAPRVIAAVAVVAALSAIPIITADRSESTAERTEPARVYAYEVGGSPTDLVLHFEHTLNGNGCDNDFAEARVVAEGVDSVDVEVLLATRPYEEGLNCDLFYGPPVETAVLGLSEPLGNRTVVAFGDQVFALSDPCVVPPRELSVIEFEPSGLAGEAWGPSLVSRYAGGSPFRDVDVTQREYAGPESWFELLPTEGCDARAWLTVIGDAQLADVYDYPLGILILSTSDGPWSVRDYYSETTWTAGSDPSTGNVLALAATSGGLGLCFRSDLLAAAGLPSAPEDVAAAMGDTWEGLVALGTRYHDATGRAFLDDASSLYPIIASQTPDLYPGPIPDRLMRSDGAEEAFDTVLAVVAAGIAAGVENGTEEWRAGAAEGQFAATPCSLPRLDELRRESGAPGQAAGWAVAGIPGPGGDLDRTWYSIPVSGADEDETRYMVDLLGRLAQPEERIKVALERGSLPAGSDVLDPASVLQRARGRGPEVAAAVETWLDIVTGGDAEVDLFIASVVESTNGQTIPAIGSDVVAVEAVLDAVERGELAASDAWAAAVSAVRDRER